MTSIVNFAFFLSVLVMISSSRIALDGNRRLSKLSWRYQLLIERSLYNPIIRIDVSIVMWGNKNSLIALLCDNRSELIVLSVHLVGFECTPRDS
jgi:hypothetical protein